MKYKIYHTPAQYFKEMSSHTGFGLEWVGFDSIDEWHHYLCSRDKTSCAMKCIENNCNSFYVDKATGNCVLGSLKEPYLVYSQPKNDGITVFRNKDLGEIKPITGNAEGEQCLENGNCRDALLCDGNSKICRKNGTLNQHYDSDFCKHNLCQEGEGDCDFHGDCEGSLKCGNNNCGRPDWPQGRTPDCCFR